MKNKEKVLKNHSPTTLFVSDQIDITCHPDYYWEHIDTSLIKIGCKFTRHTGHINIHRLRNFIFPTPSVFLLIDFVTDSKTV